MQVPEEQVIFPSIRAELDNEAKVHTFNYEKIQKIYGLSVIE